MAQRADAGQFGAAPHDRSEISENTLALAIVTEFSQPVGWPSASVARKVVLIALVMLLHEAVEPLRVVAGHFGGVRIEERIELLH